MGWSIAVVLAGLSVWHILYFAPQLQLVNPYAPIRTQLTYPLPFKSPQLPKQKGLLPFVPTPSFVHI